MLTKLQTKWKELNRPITANQRELLLGIAACTLAGVVLGLFFSPRKNQIFGSYNGCHNTGTVTGLPAAQKEAEEV